MSISSSIKFSELSKTLEKISKLTKSSDKQNLLKKFLNFYKTSLISNNLININLRSDFVSIYGLLRLLLPQLDKARSSYGLKERSLAKMYCKILCLNDESEEGRKLLLRGGGNLAEAAYEILQMRCDESSTLTIEEVNIRLDNIANASGSNRAEIIKENLIYLQQSSNAVDQKWFIRILLKNISFGMTQKTILKCYHPSAEELYNVTSDLEAVCSRLKCFEDNVDSFDVQIFKAFKPMLSERGDIRNIISQLDNMPFIYETKYDGERVQLHKDGYIYRYWSRNGLEWTKTYGLTKDVGTLTPYIFDAFKPTVNNCILDGEMMGYNNVTKKMGSKSEEFDIKNINVERFSGYLPCFIIFDVLYLNSEILTKKCLGERKRILDTDVLQSELEGKIMISKYTQALTREECLEGFNRAIENCDEGLVVKSIDSIYKVNSRKAGWFKLKPDYVLGLHEELDCVIVGGYFNGGKVIGHFLCAVKMYDANEDVDKFYSFCKVGSGFTRKILYQFNLKMASDWKTYNKEYPPKWMILSQRCKEKPDIYIEPCNSFIIQLKAAEIISSENYATKCTLRFSRIDCFREDKSPVDDCMTLSELESLRFQHKGKLALHSLEIDSENEQPVSSGSSTKKQRLKRNYQLPESLRSDVPNKQLISDNIQDSLFWNKEFSILISAQFKNSTGKKQLEKFVFENGGVIVQNPSISTTFVVTDRRTLKIQNLIRTNLYDIVYVHWLIQCFGDKTFVVLKPSHYLAMKPETLKYFKNVYDKFGDSFTDEINSKELKDLLCNMEETSVEIPELTYEQRSLFLNSIYCDNLSSTYLNGYVLHFYILSQRDSLTLIELSKINRLKIELKLAGARMEEKVILSVTHVIVFQGYVLTDIECLHSLNRERDRKFFIVSSQWVNDVLQNSSIVPENSYMIKM